MYSPHIKSAKPLLRYRLPPYTFVLLGEIESIGLIGYLYLLIAMKDDEKAPSLFVSAEVNSTVDKCGGGSHFLCIFDPEGHHNLGHHNQWANLDIFAAKALEIATQRLGLEGNPTLF
jgi:hypothetical protein